jgi:hypothetical protein
MGLRYGGSRAGMVHAQGSTDREDHAVHSWRVSRLTELGVPEPPAEEVADHIDWHDVARLVDQGCPAELAVTIVQLSG